MFAEIFLFLAFFQGVSQTALTPYEDPDAYEVYAAILPLEWPLRVAHAEQLVIQRQTKTYEMCLKPEKESQAKVGPAISEYLKLNEKVWLLQPLLRFEKPYQFLDADKVSEIWDRNGWDEYYREYPKSGGIIQLSAVGFNEDRTVAVVYVAHDCGSRCGGGTFHVLGKTGGNWKQLGWQGDRCTWSS